MITKVELHIYNLGTLPDVHWWLHLCKANRALKLIPNTANAMVMVTMMVNKV